MGGCLGAIFDAMFPRGKGCGCSGCGTVLALLLLLSLASSWLEALGAGNPYAIGVTVAALLIFLAWRLWPGLIEGWRSDKPTAGDRDNA